MIIVTGGSGFIGTNLLCFLRKMSDEDIISADLRDPPFRLPNVDYVKRDVAEMDGYSSDDLSVVYHLAAKSGVDTRHKDAVRNNVMGTVAVAEFAKQAGAHLVFASSGAVRVVGQTGIEGYANTSGYGISKMAGEKWIQTMVYREGLSASVLRFSNVYGWQPKGKSVVHAFVEAAMKGNRPWITGSGLQTRDLIHVYDVVKACVAAATLRYCGEPRDVASGNQDTLRQLWRRIEGVAGSTPRSPRFVGGPSGAPHSTYGYGMTSPMILQGWRASVKLRLGLESTVQYWEDMAKAKEEKATREVIDKYWSNCFNSFPADIHGLQADHG